MKKLVVALDLANGRDFFGGGGECGWTVWNEDLPYQRLGFYIFVISRDCWESGGAIWCVMGWGWGCFHRQTGALVRFDFFV